MTTQRASAVALALVALAYAWAAPGMGPAQGVGPTVANITTATDGAIPVARTSDRTLALVHLGAGAGVSIVEAPQSVTVAVAGSRGRATGQTAANSSVATFTVGTSDATFEVSANVLVTTATAHNFAVECAYTDEGNTPRVVTLDFFLVGGGSTNLTTSVVNTNGAVPYEGVPLHVRAKAATAITVRTQAAGIYTTVAYNVEGVIKQTS